MKRRSPAFLAAVAAFCALSPAAAQQQGAPSPLGARPVPHPVEVPRGFERAVANGTRAASGLPGPRYWQQYARYDIRAAVDAEAKTLTGSETIVYRNHSPDTLRVLVVKLWMNLHAPEAERNEPAEVTGGVQLARVAVRGESLGVAQAANAPGYRVDGTNLIIRPAVPVLPGDSVGLAIDWSFRIPQAGASGRMGHDAGNLLYLAYWHPQMAVYDDVGGWHTDQFLGSAEFYMGYGDYRYTVTAPEGWVVMGTGQLQNPEAVLPGPVLTRWRRAAGSDEVVHVLTASDFGVGKATVDSPSGTLEWTFAADSVRDVAFSVTRESLWDAARTPVGDRNGDGRTDYTLIQSLWRANAPKWARSVEYGQQSIRFLSEFTGIRYPYPHMTAVEADAIIGGGMEYPMMTLIGSYNRAASDTSLYSVTAHELAHMWVPMIVGVDETRYGWMDEGTTDFNENAAFNDFYRGAEPNGFVREQRQYLQFPRAGLDTRLLVWTDYQLPVLRGYATYPKPATVLWALRGLLGDEVFLPAYRRYLTSWAYKHPKPWDFFNAFESATGRDLDWFWSTWYDEAWTLDQAVARVEGNTIVVEDRGQAPMPARLLVTREDGRTERAEVPVETWLGGARSATVTVSTGSPVVRVEIDPEQYFPDADRANNVWTR